MIGLVANVVLLLSVLRDLRNFPRRTQLAPHHVCMPLSPNTAQVVVIAASGESADVIDRATETMEGASQHAVILRGHEGVVSPKGQLINEFVAARAEFSQVLIYDVDSEPTRLPDPDRSCVVGQQLSLYRAEPRRSVTAWSFWQGCADNQSLWSLGYERRSLRVGSLYYLVGHGLRVRTDVLRSWPLHATGPGEDLLLGYHLSVVGTAPCVLEGLDIAAAVGSVSEFVNQSERWFVGEILALQIVARDHSWRAANLLCQRAIGLVNWIAGPWLLIGSCVLSKFWPLVWLALGVRILCWRRVVTTRRAEGRFQEKEAPLWTLVGFLVKPLLASGAALWALPRLAVRGGVAHLRRARHG